MYQCCGPYYQLQLECILPKKYSTNPINTEQLHLLQICGPRYMMRKIQGWKVYQPEILIRSGDEFVLLVPTAMDLEDPQSD